MEYFRIVAALNCTVEKHIFQFDSHIKNEMLRVVVPCILV